MPPKISNEQIPGFTLLENNLYRCQICSRANVGHPMQKQAAKRSHPGSREHRDATAFLEAQRTRTQARRAQQAHLDDSWMSAPLRNLPMDVDDTHHTISANPDTEASERLGDAVSRTDRPLGLGQTELSGADRVEADLRGPLRLTMAARFARSMDERQASATDPSSGSANSDEDDLIAKIMHQMWQADLDDQEDDENNENDDMHARIHRFDPSSRDAGFEPYDSKLMFLLDWISSLPRLRVSGMLMKAFLFLLRECGVKNVPSFSHFTAKRKDLHDQFAVDTLRFESGLDNVFFMNSIPQMIAHVRTSGLVMRKRAHHMQDWMNPLTAALLQRYPERRSDGGVSQIWHGEKLLKEVPLDQLCPHHINGARHFYVNEYAQLDDGRFVIPRRWVMIDGVLHAEAWTVELDNDDEPLELYWINFMATKDIPADWFAVDYLTLRENKKIPTLRRK
jgi:hypothetical protein